MRRAVPFLEPEEPAECLQELPCTVRLLGSLCIAQPRSYGVWTSAAPAAPEEPPPALPTPAPGTGLQPHQREDWAPLQNKCLPINDTY